MRPRIRENGRGELVGERVRIFERDGRWHANYQDGRRQVRTSLKTKSKKEAKLRALAIERELLEGRHGKPIKPVGVEEAAEKYKAVLKVDGRSPKTMAKYSFVLALLVNMAKRRHVPDLAGIDQSFIDAYREERHEAGRQRKTIYTEVIIIRQLIKFALRRRLIAEDPLNDFKVNKPRPNHRECWSLQEVELILANTPGEFRLAFTILADTGLRIGELCWLTLADLDTEAHFFRIRAKEGWKPKTGDARDVPVSERLQGLLYRRRHRHRWLVTNPPSQSYAGDDRQLTERRALSALKKVLKKVGLTGTLHTFRHSFITIALLKGTPPAVVRNWVGHVDEKMTDHYTHVDAGASQAFMKKLSAARAAKTVGGSGGESSTFSAR